MGVGDLVDGDQEAYAHEELPVFLAVCETPARRVNDFAAIWTEAGKPHAARRYGRGGFRPRANVTRGARSYIGLPGPLDPKRLHPVPMNPAAQVGEPLEIVDDPAE